MSIKNHCQHTNEILNRQKSISLQLKFTVKILLNIIIMRCSFKILSWDDKVKDIIKHQHIEVHCVNIKKEDKPEIYIIYPKTKIPVMVSIYRCPVVFTSKGSTSGMK